MQLETPLQTAFAATPSHALRSTATQTGNAASDQALQETAQSFEAAFLTEMLRHAGVAENNSAFNGGAGEEAFSSFLVREYANEISQSGDFGLADQIYSDLKKKVSPDVE